MTANPYTGLTLDEERRYLAHVAERDARTKRERLVIAARWALDHDRACALDSKGWPLDENGQPLAPPPACIAETVADYRRALAMAKKRTTRRANATARGANAEFGLQDINLRGVSAAGSLGALTQAEERRRAGSKVIAELW